jgi:hypothetical protein
MARHTVLGAFFGFTWKVNGLGRVQCAPRKAAKGAKVISLYLFCKVIVFYMMENQGDVFFVQCPFS